MASKFGPCMTALICVAGCSQTVQQDMQGSLVGPPRFDDTPAPALAEKASSAVDALPESAPRYGDTFVASVPRESAPLPKPVLTARSGDAPDPAILPESARPLDTRPGRNPRRARKPVRLQDTALVMAPPRPRPERPKGPQIVATRFEPVDENQPERPKRAWPGKVFFRPLETAEATRVAADRPQPLRPVVTAKRVLPEGPTEVRQAAPLYVSVGPEYFGPDSDIAPFVVSVADDRPATLEQIRTASLAPMRAPKPRRRVLPEAVAKPSAAPEPPRVQHRIASLGRSGGGMDAARPPRLPEGLEVAPPRMPQPARIETPDAPQLVRQAMLDRPLDRPVRTRSDAPAPPIETAPLPPLPARQDTAAEATSPAPLPQPEAPARRTATAPAWAPRPTAKPAATAAAPARVPPPVRREDPLLPPSSIAEAAPDRQRERQKAQAPADQPCLVGRGSNDRMILVCKGRDVSPAEVLRAVIEGESAFRGLRAFDPAERIVGEYGFNPRRYAAMSQGPQDATDIAFLRDLRAAGSSVRLKGRMFDLYLMKGDAALATVLVERSATRGH